MSDYSTASKTPERAVSEYAAALASNAPAPGGGSAVAVTAALAAALGEMVCQFTLGKPAYAEYEVEIAEARSRLQLARTQFLQLAAEDEVAFNAYAEASELPKRTDAERVRRKDALAVALRGAAAVPLEVASLSNDLLATLEPVAKFGNPNLISDVSVATHLAEAAIHGAVANVQANAKYMTAEDSATIMSEALNLQESGRQLSVRLQEIVDSR